MPGPIDHSNPDVALLRELLNRRPQDSIYNPSVRDPLDATGNPELPSVPHPSGFRADPLINGSPKLANMVNDVFKIAPELRGRINLISTAPTPGLIEDLSKSQVDPIYSDFTNIYGITDELKGRKDIWLRHDQKFDKDSPMEAVLGHEMGHVGNRRDHGYVIPRDTDMDLIEMLSARALKR